MLSQITVENWILAAGIGIPCAVLILLALVRFLKAMRSRKHGVATYTERVEKARRQAFDFQEEIQSQLIVQQVDRLLGEICNLLQGKRDRLAAISGGCGGGEISVQNNVSDLQDFKKTGSDNLGLTEASGVSDQPPADIGKAVLELRSKGLPPEQIAKTLEISVVEVELMEKCGAAGHSLGRKSRRSISALA